jgi:hypothetical protein
MISMTGDDEEEKLLKSAQIMTIITIRVLLSANIITILTNPRPIKKKSAQIMSIMKIRVLS